MKRSNKLAVLLGATAMSLGALALTGCSVKAVDYGYSLDMTADTRGASIDFWAGFGTNINSVIETMITDFTKLTGITVNYQSQGSYDALQNAINLSASTGTYPNVAVGYPDHFAGYIYSDIQLPLNFLIDNDKNIPAKQSNGDAELAKFDYSDFYASYKTENESLKSDANGNAYVMGLPFNKSTEVMGGQSLELHEPHLIERHEHLLGE